MSFSTKLLMKIVLATLTPQVSATNLWSIPNYFASCNIQFLKWKNPNLPRNWDPPPYFSPIITNNPNLPIILDEITLNSTHSDLLGWVDSPLDRHARSNLISVALIESIVKPQILSFPVYFWLQNIIMQNLHCKKKLY